jgi:hypothetical protein
MAIYFFAMLGLFIYKFIKLVDMNIQIQDKNVLNVMARFKERSEVGIKKYKTTLERTDLTTLEWLTTRTRRSNGLCSLLGAT